MRKLVYKLENGTIVNTEVEAKTSKQNYTMEVVDIIEEYDDNRLTPMQKARRRTLA